MQSKKQFVALARVSSREQEREGFSLDVQEDALRKHAEKNDGVIAKLFRIAETASKHEERKTFKALLAHVKQNAAKIDGLLFYKVDRAARNLFDYVELEKLDSEYHVPFYCVSQPTENTPSGRMHRRLLANMASYYTEQQSLDVKEGMKRRVQSGLFIGHAPYGYRNVKIDLRSLIDVHPENGPKIQQIYDLYAYHGHTLDSLGEALQREGVTFTPSQPVFVRSMLYRILTSRAYIGEVNHQGVWHKGTHTPLVSHSVWERVQGLLGHHVYRNHDLTYAGERITCAHCGHPITGEVKSKATQKHGMREYTYYRCSHYTAKDHPRIRVREEQLDEQILALFDQLKIEDPEIVAWFRHALRESSKEKQSEGRDRNQEFRQQLTDLERQEDSVLQLRVNNEIDTDTFARKKNALREEQHRLKLQLESYERGHAETSDLAIKTFELSQCLRQKYVTADSATKRNILEIVCLNFTLDGVTLVPEIRKPFDVLAKGIEKGNGRGERI